MLGLFNLPTLLRVPVQGISLVVRQMLQICLVLVIGAVVLKLELRLLIISNVRIAAVAHLLFMNHVDHQRLEYIQSLVRGFVNIFPCSDRC